jgi:hypothetical protein
LPRAAAPPPAAIAAPSAEDLRWPFSANAGPLDEEAATVAIEDGTITVEGEPAGTTKEVEDFGKLKKIDGVFDRLKELREAWKMMRPMTPFPGRVALRITLGTPMIVVKSAFQTAAFAGYPNLGFVVRTGPGGKEGALWVEAQIPRPPDPTTGLMYPDHRLRLVVAPQAIATIWMKGTAVLSEESHTRAPCSCRRRSPRLRPSPALAELIRSAWVLRGPAAQPGTAPPEEAFLVGVDDREPYASLIGLLDAVEATRKGSGTRVKQLKPTFSIR